MRREPPHWGMPLFHGYAAHIFLVFHRHGNRIENIPVGNLASEVTEATTPF
jgi:hypothetical protein